MTLTGSIQRLKTEVNLLTTRATGEQRARLRLAADALADAMDAKQIVKGAWHGYDDELYERPGASQEREYCETCGSNDPRYYHDGLSLHLDGRLRCHNSFHPRCCPSCGGTIDEPAANRCLHLFHQPDEETHRREYRYPPRAPATTGR